MIRNELFFWIGGLRSTLSFKQWDTDTGLVYCFESITDWCAISKTEKFITVGRDAIRVAAQRLASDLSFGLNDNIKYSESVCTESEESDVIDTTGILFYTLASRLAPTVSEQCGIDLKNIDKVHLLDPGGFFQEKHQHLVAAMDLYHQAQAIYHPQKTIVESLKNNSGLVDACLILADEKNTATPPNADAGIPAINIHQTFDKLLSELQKAFTDISQARLATVALFDNIEELGLGDWVEHTYGLNLSQQTPLIVDSLHFWRSFEASHNEPDISQDSDAKLYIGDYSKVYTQYFPLKPEKTVETMTRCDAINRYQANIEELPDESVDHLKIEINSELIAEPDWKNTGSAYECKLQQSINLFGNTSTKIDIRISESSNVLQSWQITVNTLVPLNIAEYEIQLIVSTGGSIKCNISTEDDISISNIEKYCYKKSGLIRTNDILNRIVYIP